MKIPFRLTCCECGELSDPVNGTMDTRPYLAGWRHIYGVHYCPMHSDLFMLDMLSLEETWEKVLDMRGGEHRRPWVLQEKRVVLA